MENEILRKTLKNYTISQKNGQKWGIKQEK